MAVVSAVQSLQDEVTCSVCLELFTDPVMIVGCGHNFCRACIAQCWEGAETDVTCPPVPCKHILLRQQLRSLSAPSSSPLGYGAGKRLQLLPSKENGNKEFPFPQEQIQTQLQLLRGERDRLEALRGSESQKHQEYQQKAAAERQKIVAAFERLRRFLEEQERVVLAELGELERGIEKSQGETVTQLSEEISHLTNLIRELEGKCQQAASDLQDMRSTLSRYKKEQFQLPEGICPELENETWCLLWTKFSSLGDFEEVSRDSAIRPGEGQRGTTGIVHEGDGDSGSRHGKSLPCSVCGLEKCET
ncbi:E3 ubiquitin-protein ligase TRIM7-like [Alligator sinensis]|uniref:E3 ubiquitin-protein ligase TRIM7-like n=1 Tax=Alligator sinensis TaxID=38654 RepID=A0A3Q0HQI2_ALLSI|nr:E3 ubiquitin-protein ligase TRIM7-like [Alligator sinensis]